MDQMEWPHSEIWKDRQGILEGIYRTRHIEGGHCAEQSTDRMLEKDVKEVMGNIGKMESILGSRTSGWLRLKGI